MTSYRLCGAIGGDAKTRRILECNPSPLPAGEGGFALGKDLYSTLRRAEKAAINVPSSR